MPAMRAGVFDEIGQLNEFLSENKFEKFNFALNNKPKKVNYKKKLKND